MNTQAPELSHRNLEHNKMLLSQFIENAPAAIAMCDREMKYIMTSRRFLADYDLPPQNLAGRSHYEVFPEIPERLKEIHRRCLAGKVESAIEDPFPRKNGKLDWVRWEVQPWYEESGEIGGIIIFSEVITERKNLEETLRKSEARFKTAFFTSPDSININRLSDGIYISVNKGFSEITGYSEDEVIGRTSLEINIWHDPNDRARLIEELKMRGKVENLEARFRMKNGEIRYGMMSAALMELDGTPHILSVTRDITQRKIAEEKQEKLQEQLNQAQKLESIGRLAGGVAHDFNNILTVILGHAQLAKQRCAHSEMVYEDLEIIENSAIRSADLVRQLLGFARRQTVAPMVLDLNDTVSGMLKMLQRLIGEEIDFGWMPGPALWQIKIDPSQIDQILANLCVNARDAISGVGKITIETANATFDERYCQIHAGYIAGDYIMIAVSDDGCGIDEAAMAHVFEPFFTTKEKGKGTGLGLSTVYGIVKQNGGFLNIYSEPGKGTTFKIYFPRLMGELAHTVIPPALEQMPKGGGEIVLLVEDEPAILNLGKRMLESLGYSVLPAGTPGEAVILAKNYGNRIRLLITDVVMPEMNGKDLEKLLHEIIPDLRGLFSSGYTSNVIAHRGVLEEGVHFLQKPYSVKDLATKVREALGQ